VVAIVPEANKHGNPLPVPGTPCDLRYQNRLCESDDQPIYLLMLPDEWLTQSGFLLLALPVIALLIFAWIRGEGRRAAIPMPGFEWLPRASGRGGLQARTGITLRAVALLALVPLVVGPAEKSGDEKRVAAGALVVVLDNSSSMTAGDFRPFNRLDAARRSLRSFLTRLPETEIGLVALAGSPQVVAPVTRDRRFVLGALERIGPAASEDDGTAIGAGVASAVNRLRNGGNEPRRILLITDGVSNRGTVSATDAAEVARMMDIRVDAIGIGTDTISRFSVPAADGVQREVEARIEIDDRALDGLATRTGGSYSRVRSLADLEKALAGLEATYLPARPSAGRDLKRNWMEILALVALSLVGVEMLFRHFIIREIPQ